MLAASLMCCLSMPLQDPEAPKPPEIRTPRSSRFAYGVFESESRHTQKGVRHWHRPLIAYGGGLQISDSGTGVFSMQANWQESRAKVQCDDSILLHVGKVKRTEADLHSVRDENGQILSVRASFRGYFPDPGRSANLDPTHRTSSDPPWDVKYERLMSHSTVEGRKTPKGYSFTQVGNSPAYGPALERSFKVGDTSKVFVSTSEALLADPGRLKEFAATAKKGEPPEFDVLTLLGVVRYRLHFAGQQWIVFKNLNATLDRFELRTTKDKGTSLGSFWLDEKGNLALFWIFGKFDLGYTSMYGTLGTPSGPQIDTTTIWPVMMTIDHIWKLPMPPRKSN